MNSGRRALGRRIAVLRRANELARGAGTGATLTVLGLTAITALGPAALVLLARSFVDAALPRVGHVPRASTYVPLAIAIAVVGATQRTVGTIQSNRLEGFAREVGRLADARFLRAAYEGDMRNFDDPDWHDRMSRAARELTFRPTVLIGSTVTAIGAVLTLGALVAALTALSPLVVALALFATILPTPLQRRSTRDIYQYHFGVSTEEREQSYLRTLLTDAGAAAEARAYGFGPHVLARQQRLAAGINETLRRLRSRASWYAVVAGTTAAIALAVAYSSIGRQAAHGEITAGDLTAVIAAVAAVAGQFTTIVNAALAFDENAAFVDDYFAFVDQDHAVATPSAPLPLPSTRTPRLTFDNVSFTYPAGTRPAIDGLSFEVAPGELIAIVGENGSGKTTLAKLLLRFYDPTEGNVRFGGVDLREVDPSAIRERFGVVFQAPLPIFLTARDQVAFGRPEQPADDTAIWAALRAARADHIVAALPQQLDSTVGPLFEGGHNLSGGEWQRLALARLMYRDADVWILDEPTAHLDPSAEAQIFGDVRKMLGERGGVLISHRFTTTRVADRILVLAHGGIVETGTHDELLASGGTYAEMYRAQAEQFR